MSVSVHPEIGSSGQITPFYRLDGEHHEDIHVVEASLKAHSLSNLAYYNRRINATYLRNCLIAAKKKTHGCCSNHAIIEHLEEPKIKLDALQIERDWISMYKVDPLTYTSWNDETQSPITLCGKPKHFLQTQCTTGVIRDYPITKDIRGDIPFVSFRGTQTLYDGIADARATIPIPFRVKNMITSPTDSSGVELEGYIGEGYIHVISEFIKLKQLFYEDDNTSVEQVRLSTTNTTTANTDNTTTATTTTTTTIRKTVERNFIEQLLHLINKHDNGVILTGHSLGAACALVFLLELIRKYNGTELISKYKHHIHLITFASPKAINDELAQFVNQLPIVHLRFVNNDDFLTLMPPPTASRSANFVHAGKAIYPYLPSRWDTILQLHDAQTLLKTNVLPDWHSLSEKLQKESLWMVVYDPHNQQQNELSRKSKNKVKDHNFAADARSNKQFSRFLPRAFLESGGRVHTLMEYEGYVGHFCNYGRDEGESSIAYVRVGRVGQSYYKYAEDLWNILSRKDYNPLTSTLPTPTLY